MINMDAKSEPAISQECREHGRKLRAARITAGKTLCDVTHSAAADLVTASAIERGIVSNLHIKPDEWVQ
jgi:hypothetical protein